MTTAKVNELTALNETMTVEERFNYLTEKYNGVSRVLADHLQNVKTSGKIVAVRLPEKISGKQGKLFELHMNFETKVVTFYSGNLAGILNEKAFYFRPENNGLKEKNLEVLRQSEVNSSGTNLFDFVTIDESMSMFAFLEEMAIDIDPQYLEVEIEKNVENQVQKRRGEGVGLK